MTLTDNFIFVHINKTGGSSIEQVLGRPLEHKTARDYIADMGVSEWQRSNTFSVVRNPWDRVVSLYFWRVKTNQTGLAENPIEFHSWVKAVFENKNSHYYDKPKMFMPCIEWLLDESGEVAVDKIGRFESLERDFSVISRRLGIEAKLPHLKQTLRAQYQQYYNGDTRRIVAQWFRNDIEYFDYHF